MSHIALIIDDEPDILELLGITLQRMGVDCRPARDLQEARRLLKARRFDICLTDMKLPDGNGIDFVAEAQKQYPAMPIAVITAHGSMDSAIVALKSGAFDFLTKPVDLEALRALVKNALDISGMVRRPRPPGHDLVGNSEPLLELKRIIEKVSKSQAPVYISGESGTGKERVARMIHASGPRASQPFIPVNCGAIPGDLLESELFGHIKGSFTGAITDKKGLFQAAHGGALFLDEVAELPQHMQVKLLRAIQEKTIRPVGSQKEIQVDIRILSATNKDLQRLVDEDRFRQDLFYRINVIAINVPPLRDRIEDIAPLADHIIGKITAKEARPRARLTGSALAALGRYSFPGNIRELENILERALALGSGDVIEAHDLRLPEAGKPDPRQADSADLPSLLVDMERQKILDALEKTRWNKTKAARLLGISFRALRYRLSKLDLD